MKIAAAATVVSLCFITLYCFPVMGVKEEPDLTANLFRAPVRELLSVINPDDLYPLCSNIATVYERLLKRGPTFNAWGGKKRAFPMSRLMGSKRNANGGSSQFNPWGGKRADADDYILNSDDKIVVGAHV